MMSDPFELNDPFSTMCETCGMRDCFGHDETQRSIRLIHENPKLTPIEKFIIFFCNLW
jgi:hypothetical protein